MTSSAPGPAGQRDDVHLRRARPDDGEVLSALALRSKSHWPYDAEFLARMRSALVMAPEYLADWPVYVLERAGRAIGFYGFRVFDGELFLHDMWLEPVLIGSGLGRRLWTEALATARAAGHGWFLIESDPNAEGFYLRMGARRVGTRVSPDSGRTLPLLRYDLAEPGDLPAVAKSGR